MMKLAKAVLLLSIVQRAAAFAPSSSRVSRAPVVERTPRFDGAVEPAAPRERAATARRFSAAESEIAGWVVLFSGTHVGLSAARDPLIALAGRAARRAGAVGGALRFPDYWLGDAAGNALWPDEAAAGRQLFRVAYSAVAAASLGGAFVAFAASRVGSAALLPPDVAADPAARAAAFGAAVAALAVSTASLVNPSPLSLVPGFKSDAAAPLGLVRDDTLKLAPYGLTRVTRHPLILPVVPWGVANAVLAGGSVADVTLFGGLAVYALVGCYAQDGRAAAAAEVGTVFARGDLTGFYDETSFVPFAAVVDGRQRLADVAAEVPWAYLVLGALFGVASEAATLLVIDASAPW